MNDPPCFEWGLAHLRYMVCLLNSRVSESPPLQFPGACRRGVPREIKDLLLCSPLPSPGMLYIKNFKITVIMTAIKADIQGTFPVYWAFC